MAIHQIQPTQIKLPKSHKGQDALVAAGTAAVIGGSIGAFAGMNKNPDIFEYGKTGMGLITKTANEMFETPKLKKRLMSFENLVARTESGIKTASKRLKTLAKFEHYPKKEEMLKGFVEKHKNELFETTIKDGVAKKTPVTFANTDEAMKFFQKRLDAFSKTEAKIAKFFNGIVQTSLDGGKAIADGFVKGKGFAYDVVTDAFKNQKAKKYAALVALFAGVGAGLAVLTQKEKTLIVPVAVPVPVPVPVECSKDSSAGFESKNDDITDDVKQLQNDEE